MKHYYDPPVWAVYYPEANGAPSITALLACDFDGEGMPYFTHLGDACSANRVAAIGRDYDHALELLAAEREREACLVRQAGEIFAEALR